MTKSLIAQALERVEVSRAAFLNSNAPRYSDEYYKLLSRWDDDYKAMLDAVRVQNSMIKGPFKPVMLSHPVTKQEQAYRDVAARNAAYVANLPIAS